MRHRKKGRKLNRTASHKKAMLRNLANQLIEHKEIRTTTAKAKEAKPTVERLITYAKKGDLHHRRLAFSFLRQKSSINTLFDEIAPTFSDRQGGYTRVVKLGRRLGDGAPMSILQLVGFESLGESAKKEAKKKTKKKTAKSEDTTSVREKTASAETAAAEKTADKASTDVKDEVKPEPEKAEASAPAEEAPPQTADSEVAEEAKSDK